MSLICGLPAVPAQGSWRMSRALQPAVSEGDDRCTGTTRQRWMAVLW